MLQNFKKHVSNIKKDFQEIELNSTDIKRVTRRDVENLMKIIDVAYGCCDFELELNFKNGTFLLDSTNFKGIKILDMDGKIPESVVLSYSDSLSKTDFTVPIKNIDGIYFSLVFVNEGEE